MTKVTDPTVLIVDDEQSFVDAVGMFLEEHGYKVVKAYGGREGRMQLRAGQPDLALIDVHMPDVDGIELLSLASHVAKPVPVIMITSDDAEAIARSCEALGAVRFLVKPVAPEDLLNIIQLVTSRAFRVGPPESVGCHCETHWDDCSSP